MEEKLHVAVVGSGGREHAVIKKLLGCARTGRITALPGNGGIARDVPCVPLAASDTDGITRWCAENAADYVVVTPDDPLAMGLVDALAARNIPAFGPTRKAARLEWSKSYAKSLMKKYGVPTARYEAFDRSAEALRYTRACFEAGYPGVVVKADGLALGKGVRVCMDSGAAEAAVRASLDEGRFGQSGATVVIEEYLRGVEASVLSFCDGERVVPMVSAMDHKRAGEGDAGENTGGMGAVAPNPFYTPALAAACMEEIYLPTMRMMRDEGAPFRGCLYFGLMLTADGPKVIEYNCRFGDPETQAVLALLESDLLEAMLACTEGRLRPGMVRFSTGAAACVVLASGGYPGAYRTGFEVEGLDAAEAEAGVFCAGVVQKDGRLYTAGGRVACVCARAPRLEEALDRAYRAAARIRWQDMFFRRDIGRTALTQG